MLYSQESLYENALLVLLATGKAYSLVEFLCSKYDLTMELDYQKERNNVCLWFLLAMSMIDSVMEILFKLHSIK